MKRKNKETPTAILSADWHIRGDRPVCRTDNYMNAQEKKITFIQELAYKHSCPILIAGDIGHRPLWGDKLLNWFIGLVRNRTSPPILIISIPGQHDLLNHRLDKLEEGGLGVITKSIENFEIELSDCYLTPELDIQIHTFPYSKKIKTINKTSKIHIAMTHQMVIQSQKKKLWNDQIANHGKRLLKKFPCYNLIISGDNHQSFVVEHEGRLLVNPGSLMRMSANQIDHKPSVYLYYAKSNKVERIYIPIEQGVINRDHIDIIKDRDKRIESFVNKLKDSGEISMSFTNNMKQFIKLNKIKKKVKQKIWEALV